MTAQWIAQRVEAITPIRSAFARRPGEAAVKLALMRDFESWIGRRAAMPSATWAGALGIAAPQ